MKTEKILKTNLHMTDETLESIMNQELQKPPEEMDADLVGICSEILYRRHALAKKSSNVVRTRRKNIMKLIAIAAAITILLTSLAAVFAEIGPDENDIARQMINSVDGIQTEIDTKNNDTTPENYALLDTALVKQIVKTGITNPITIPEIFTKDYKIKNIADITPQAGGTNASLSKTVKIDFKKGWRKGYIAITQSDVVDIPQSTIVYLKNIELFTANGLDVLLLSFKNDGESKPYYLIKYYDSVQQINYSITILCKREEVLQLIQSIK